MFSFVFPFLTLWNPLFHEIMNEEMLEVVRHVLNHAGIPQSSLIFKILWNRGVKGVRKPILWYFRDIPQNNLKLMGTYSMCVIYLLRGFENICLNKQHTNYGGWVTQSLLTQTFWVLVCVFQFSFFFFFFFFFGVKSRIWDWHEYHQYVDTSIWIMMD